MPHPSGPAHWSTTVTVTPDCRNRPGRPFHSRKKLGSLNFFSCSLVLKILLFLCGSCHFDRALNDEFSVKYLF